MKHDINGRNINVTLNVVKCIAVLAVICIHCKIHEVGLSGRMIVNVARFAVPFFILISGYYSFYESRQTACEKYKTRILRLLKLTVISNAIYFIYRSLISGKAAGLDLNMLVKVFIFNVSPYADMLWFLQALLYCYIIYYILNRYGFDLRKLYRIMPILFIANFALGEFTSLFFAPIEHFYYRNFLFTGLPFFILGYMIHDKKDRLDSVNDRLLIVACTAMAVASMFEPIVLGVKCDIQLSCMIFSVILFMWCVKNPQKLKFNRMAWIGGTLYTSMYVLHFLVILILKPALHYGLFNPLIVFALTAMIASVSLLR